MSTFDAWYKNYDDTKEYLAGMHDAFEAGRQQATGFRGRIAARLDEYKLVAQMIPGIEKRDWYKRRLAHLQEMYEQAGPQDAQPQVKE